MGQYHFICNLDREEYLDPHRFGDGLKLFEFGSSAGGTLTGLAVLLSEQNGRGGGDLAPRTDADPERAAHLMNKYVGRWAGDRIAIIGDYFDAETDPIAAQGNPWRNQDEWDDISDEVVETILLDHYTHQEFMEHRKDRVSA